MRTGKLVKFLGHNLVQMVKNTDFGDDIAWNEGKRMYKKLE